MTILFLDTISRRQSLCVCHVMAASSGLLSYVLNIHSSQNFFHFFLFLCCSFQTSLQNSTDHTNVKDSWMAGFVLKGGKQNVSSNTTPRSVSAESIGAQTPPVTGSPKVEKRETQGINLLPDVVSLCFMKVALLRLGLIYLWRDC